jgi:hypothetical protein
MVPVRDCPRRRVAVLAASVLWVFANDAAFQEIATETTEQRRNRPQRGRGTSYRARQAGWTLAPTGRPEAAFAWKSALQTFRVVDRRILLRLVLILVWIAIIVSSLSRTRGLAAAGGLFSITGALLAMLLGPLALRIDLRQDLQHLELLKTCALRAAAVVRGEMLWPTAVLTIVSWTLIVTASIFRVRSSRVRRRRCAFRSRRRRVCDARRHRDVIHHSQRRCTVLPAWMATGVQRRCRRHWPGLILVGGTVLLLTIAVAPGVIAGGLVYLAFGRFIGPAALIPAAAIGAVIVVFEVLMGTEMLGLVYERLDLLAVERTE